MCAKSQQMSVLWPYHPANADTLAQEMAVSFDVGRMHRVLVVPALLEEASKMRRFTVELMRRLDGAGVDSFLPDLAGCDESFAPLEAQTLCAWRRAMEQAALHFGASHVLTIRGGALLAPRNLQGWCYAPVGGADQLRNLLRGRVLAAREAGREESREALQMLGMAEGLELAGMRLGTEFLREWAEAMPDHGAAYQRIAQHRLGLGGGLWLRAEPGEDAGQADALAAIVIMALRDVSSCPRVPA